ncbi:Wzz/FepE/Etk N-terminal domain-containing protein [Vibrio coralliilyticus]|uniref:Wzz/FepE/Etk N-terminal domain-containing protein n=1 Tax=Vibrio coralliilyticus TaxID=190893 RepID=UPI001F5B676E|nr:Wzz/FepE/Etk N-terminal domain-containing protein [Vibrio coralliilyticus]
MSGQNQPLANNHYSPEAPSASQPNDEIDIRELFTAIWASRLIIFLSTLAFSVGAVTYASYKPDVYKTSATYIVERGFYNASGILEPRLTPKYVASRDFKHQIAEIADIDESVIEGVNISYDQRNQSMLISKLSLDPQLSFEGVEAVSRVINDVVKHQELRKVNLALEALVPQNAVSVRTQDYLDELIARQLFKKAMLEITTTELIKGISLPAKSDTPIGPNRKLIVVIGSLLGGMLGVAIVLIRFAFRREQD